MKRTEVPLNIHAMTQPPQRVPASPGALLRVCMTCGEGRHDVPPGVAASHGLCPGCLLDLDPEAHAEVYGDVARYPRTR